jgi:hypothetical protein
MIQGDYTETLEFSWNARTALKEIFCITDEDRHGVTRKKREPDIGPAT